MIATNLVLNKANSLIANSSVKTTDGGVSVTGLNTATIAAKKVAIGAPMTGMNAPKNTMAARAGAMGTWRIRRPMKTRIESHRATTTVPRV